MCMMFVCMCVCVSFIPYYVAIPPPCIDGDVRLAENNTYEYTESDQIEGYVEICIGGRFLPVCYDSSLRRVAELSCQQIGYDSKYRYCRSERAGIS